MEVVALQGSFTVMIVFAMWLDVLAAESVSTAASPSMDAGVMFPPSSQAALPCVAMLLPRAASRPADLPWRGGPVAGALGCRS